MRRLLALLFLALPLSAERGSDLGKLAAELERALGPGSVSVIPSGVEGSPSRNESRDPSTALGMTLSVVDAMNRERALHGLAPLRLNRALCQAANDRIDDMFAQRYFAHVAPDGTQPFVWVARRGYDYRRAGENLALGYRGAAAIVDGWMSSPGHRANILNRGYDEVGLAVADGSPTSGRGPTVVALYATSR